MMTEYLRVNYDLTLEQGEDAEAKAVGIAYEQTAELAPELVPADLAEHVPGQIRSLDALPGGRWRAVIDYEATLLAGELTQTLNLLFGNISLKRGIRIVDIEWPATLLAALGGPGHGTAGLRALTGQPGRALSATALKPMGLGTDRLAALTRQFAAGGIDIIKDDHGISDQPQAPFDERLGPCRAAAGDDALYFPNITAPWPRMMERAERARAEGCRGVLMSPMLTGLDAMRHVRDELGLAIMAHPSLTGAFFQDDHGIAAELLLGDVFRMAGADAVIYPNIGGRFGFSAELCEAINDRLRRPFSGLRPAMPAPGGGMALDQAGYWAHHYGADTILLIGGSLYAGDDPERAARTLRTAIEEAI